MEFTELERAVIEQAKIEAVRICQKYDALMPALDELEALYGKCENDHFLWFVDFFIRTYHIGDIATPDSFKSQATQRVHGAAMAVYNPRPPNNGAPTTTGEAASR